MVENSDNSPVAPTRTQWRNARLLTVTGYGHTTFLNPSRCAADAERAYLVGGTLPSPGTVCRQDATPFGAPAAP